MIDIPGYEGKYAATSDGKIWSYYKRAWVKVYLNKSEGYLHCILWRDNKYRHHYVHRLVALTFLGPSNKPEVNHKDCNKINNHYLNLEWVTKSENMQHMVRNGRANPQRGESNTRATLKEKDVVQILRLKGILTYEKIAKRFHTNYSNVAHIMRGSRWHHIWEREKANA